MSLGDEMEEEISDRKFWKSKCLLAKLSCYSIVICLRRDLAVKHPGIHPFTVFCVLFLYPYRT